MILVIFINSSTTTTTTTTTTPCCRVLLQKLTGLQLVKKFPAFHGTRRFITALTSVRHLSLFWAGPIQYIYPHPTSWRSILILSTPRSPQWYTSLRFPPQDPIHPPSPHPCEQHAQPISFFWILSPAQYWVRSTNNLVPRYAISSIPPVTSSLLGPNILNTMFSNTLSSLSSRNVNDQVSHPYKTTGKIIVIYILIFKFLDTNLEDKIFCTEWQQAYPDLKLKMGIEG